MFIWSSPLFYPSAQALDFNRLTLFCRMFRACGIPDHLDSMHVRVAHAGYVEGLAIRCSIRATKIGTILAVALLIVPASLRADIIRYFDGGKFDVVSRTLAGTGYNTSDTAIESTAEGCDVPVLSGGTTRLDFTFVRDLGGYKFSFGVFDRSAVTADPVSDRQNWTLQALGTATVAFDNREVGIGATTAL